MHDKIEPFHLSGEIMESALLKEQERIVEFLEGSMRDDGYIPVLDIDPQWSLEYEVDKGIYKFDLTIYGVKEENAWDYAGTMNGKLIPRTTAKNT